LLILIKQAGLGAAKKEKKGVRERGLLPEIPGYNNKR
jgi:hypothetical protein